MTNKKTFTKGNVAQQFLEDNEEQQQEQVQEQAQAVQPAQQEEQVELIKPFVYVKQQAELKTKRLQLVLKPSLFNKLKAKAQENDTSVNDYINQLLEQML